MEQSSARFAVLLLPGYGFFDGLREEYEGIRTWFRDDLRDLEIIEIAPAFESHQGGQLYGPIIKHGPQPDVALPPRRSASTSRKISFPRECTRANAGVTHSQKQGRRIAARILASVGQERSLLLVNEIDWAVQLGGYFPKPTRSGAFPTPGVSESLPNIADL